MDENKLRLIVLNNFIKMLERKNKQEITEFKNNSTRMSLYLYALGASDKILELPAHREQIEECLKFLIDTASDALSDGETDIQLEHLENGIKINTENRKIQEAATLQFYDDYYIFNSKRNIGETLKRIKGSRSKRTIAIYRERLETCPFTETKTLSKKVLDEEGFVIDESIESSNGIKKHISRNNLYIVEENSKAIKWNGDAFELNEKDMSNAEFIENMSYILSKYPNTQKYYEQLIGKDIVESVLRTIREK